MNYTMQLGDNEIYLDTALDLNERIEYCEEIISTYGQYFRYQLPKDYNDYWNNSDMVKSRLNQLASYILAATSNGSEYPVQTEYKTRIIRNSESNFNLFEEIQ